MPTSRAADGDAVPGLFRPRLTLQTFTRGDGLLGLRAMEGFGPRSTQATVATVDWTYETSEGLRWETPAPTRLVNARGKATELLRGAWDTRVLLQRDLAAEADARDALWGSGLRPLPARALQWRSPEAAEGHGALWSLAEESHFGDFWADVVPRLQKAGWRIVVRAGFAHESVPVERWKLVIDRAADGAGSANAGGSDAWRELDQPLGSKVQSLAALRNPHGEGSWLLSLGVEVEGETLDLSPMLADLIKRDGRWLDAREIAAIDDEAIVRLRAPGGRRIDARAAPLKAIVGAMVDLLTDPHRAANGGQPLRLSAWEARRRGLAVSLPTFIPFVGAWIQLKDAHMSPQVEAAVAFAGPLAGTVAAFAAYALGSALDAPWLLAVAYAGFFLNLINLIQADPAEAGVFPGSGGHCVDHSP